MIQNLAPPSISIVMITFNHERFIQKSIESVLLQNCKYPLELIISNDNSTDDTDIIINETLRKINHKIEVNYFNHKKNKGVINNFIWSMSQAKGKYIALCEGDDYWTDEYKLQKQVDFLESNPAYSGCYHDTMVKYYNDSKPDHFFRESLPQSMTAEDTIALFAPFHTSSFMFISKYFAYQPFLSTIKSGDMALFSIVASKGLLGKVDGVMSVYRKHENGITNSSTHKLTFNQDRIKLINYLNQFHKYKYKAKAKQVNAIRKEIIRDGRRKNSKLIKLINKIKKYSNRTIKFLIKKPSIAK